MDKKIASLFGFAAFGVEVVLAFEVVRDERFQWSSNNGSQNCGLASTPGFSLKAGRTKGIKVIQQEKKENCFDQEQGVRKKKTNNTDEEVTFRSEVLGFAAKISIDDIKRGERGRVW